MITVGTRQLPPPIAQAWAWQLQAACRGADVDLFFSPDGERGLAQARRDAAAIAVCGRCPVLDRCRQHALAAREPAGVWGGLTAKDRALILEREDLRRIRTALARGTSVHKRLDAASGGVTTA